jgi:hypothetical protein
LPDEADAPLFIDEYAVLSFSAAFQSFELVVGRDSQITQLYPASTVFAWPLYESIAEIAWYVSAERAFLSLCT